MGSTVIWFLLSELRPIMIHSSIRSLRIETSLCARLCAGYAGREINDTQLLFLSSSQFRDRKPSSKHNYNAMWKQDSRVHGLLGDCGEYYGNCIKPASAGPGVFEIGLWRT